MMSWLVCGILMCKGNKCLDGRIVLQLCVVIACLRTFHRLFPMDNRLILRVVLQTFIRVLQTRSIFNEWR